MNKILFIKLGAIAVLTAIIAIALNMIDAIIAERTQFHEAAVKSIAEDSVSSQSIVGPILITPYTEEYDEAEAYNDENNQKKSRMVHTERHKFLATYPDNLDINGDIVLDQRYRGIHKVQVYSGQHQISGSFITPSADKLERGRADSKLTAYQSFISIGISDVRGIHKIDGINWDGKRAEFQQGSGLAAFPGGLHAPIEAVSLDNPGPVKFSFNVKLDGMQTLSFTPLGKNNNITLTSKWPHPQFLGRFLPGAQTRLVTHDGFSASWDISALATNAQAALTSEIDAGAARADGVAANDRGAADTFGVSFIEPVNIYSMAERAVKYGLLFVVLTFSAFFLFEILKRLPIHPVQYGLVGLSLAMFFLLLVSLSEQIAFLQAYLIASSACILLNGFYLSHVLHNWRRGWGFGAALTMLYGVLYGVLQSENNALLMGSILLFGVLTAIMVATRKLDWYQIGKLEVAGEAEAM